MYFNPQPAQKTVHARLTLDVTYLLNSESPPQMLLRLQRMCERAIGLGLLAADTTAKVQSYELDVRVPPRPRSDAENAALEAEIASYLGQRIEDGNLSAEDIPVRLARYALMAPEAFVSEMRERMEIALDDEAQSHACAALFTDPANSGKIDMQVAVACANASGVPDMQVFTVKATQEEYDLGAHYDKAQALAEEAGYQKPFVCFGPAEQNAIQSAARALDLVTQVVAIDITDGQFHSARCDVGKVKVICYDRDYAHYDCSENISEHPIGEDGQRIYCWMHYEGALVDSGLKKSRGY